MIVYNITYMISHEVHDEWLTWMKEIHVPEMMATGLFERNQLLRILEVDETEGISFAVQFFVSNLDNYNNYISNYAPALRLKGTQKWTTQVLGFRTLMEIVQ
jgi:hypothetical protein